MDWYRAIPAIVSILGLAALLVALGRVLQRVDDLDKRVEKLEASSTDHTLWRVEVTTRQRVESEAGRASPDPTPPPRRSKPAV